MRIRMTAHRLGLFLTAACLTSCGSLHPCFAHCSDPLFQPDADASPAIVKLAPTAEWMETGIMVHRGQRLFVTTTGEVHWQARDRTTTADGEQGVPGWKVGPGGVRGRIGVDGKPFDLGARTTPTADRHVHGPHHRYQPLPVRMSREGPLYLGFKNFTPGANTGTFETTLRPAVRVTR
jgi:hypothetical protein